MIKYKKSDTKKFTIQEWLSLHSLNCDNIQQILGLPRTFNHSSERFRLASCISPYTAQNAWDTISQVLAAILPQFEEETIQLSRGCIVDFLAPRSDPPYTLVQDGNRFPTVSMSYEDRAEDVLCMAHEFGHALQLYLAKGEFIPPMYREVAAFFSERLFLEHVEIHEPDIGVALRAAWERDNQIYLESDRQALVGALHCSDTPYTYRFNYPLARLLIIEMTKSAIVENVVSIFQQPNKAIRELIGKILFSGIKNMQNYLPEAPEFDKEKPAINAYRSLGMMTLLDIDYWQGESQETIENYYTAHLSHMQTQTAFVALGKDRKPIGYATWDMASGDNNVIQLKRQAAPFGDHLELQQILQRRLPENAKVLSHHARSAREEQIAW